MLEFDWSFCGLSMGLMISHTKPTKHDHNQILTKSQKWAGTSN